MTGALLVLCLYFGGGLCLCAGARWAVARTWRIEREETERERLDPSRLSWHRRYVAADG